jgi:ribosomal protein S18 acetylase RimI-like enzyme
MFLVLYVPLLFIVSTIQAHEIQILPANTLTETNWQELKGVFTAAFTGAYETLTVTDLNSIYGSIPEHVSYGFEHDRETCNWDDFLLAMTKDKNKIVGYALATLNTDHSIYIQHLVVDPAVQKQGVGKSLLEHIKTCFLSGNKLCLITRLLNTQARAFYQHMGFHEREYIPEFLSSYQKDSWIYLERTI